jgi:hypothetical protein
VRLPNGHVLATFQHAHHDATEEPIGKTGGLVEIDDAGKVIAPPAMRIRRLRALC